MRYSLFLSLTLLFSFLLSGCASMDKLLDEGNYDTLIEKSIRRLSGKKKKDPKLVYALERAFERANRRDLALINRYKREGQPHLWERINQLYRQVQSRQARINPLLPLIDKNGHRAEFVFADVEDMERQSRTKAAEYLYARAEQFLTKARKGDKQAARTAYARLKEINRYFRSFRDKDALLEEAHYLGVTRVLVDVSNELPPHFHPFIDRAFSSIGLAGLNSFWYEFTTREETVEKADYRFRLRLVDYLPGREQLHQREWLREKEVEDGWEYVLDENGNVAKDSLGNDIRQTRWARVRAAVTELRQEKQVQLLAEIEWMDLGRGRLQERIPLKTSAHFTNRALSFTGDERALTEEDLCSLGGRPLPFPPDGELLLQAVENLKPLFLNRIAEQLNL